MSTDDDRWDEEDDLIIDHGLGVGRTDGRTDGRSDEEDGPNYTRRRMAAAGVLILILLLVGAAGWIASRSPDETTTFTQPRWDAVIEAARTTGDLLLLDAEGAIVADAPGLGLTSAVFTHEDRLALLGPREISLRSTDLADEDVVTIELAPQWSINRMRTHAAMTFLASPSTPGNLNLIDGSTGATLDVGVLSGQRSPIFFPDTVIADRPHRVFALGDGRNFQTVVVGFDRPTAAFFPGVPVAVSAEVVVTATTVGQSSELGVFSIEGQRLSSIRAERPVGTLLRGDRLLSVSGRGALEMITLSTGATETLTPLVIPAGDEVQWAAPGLDHQRLIVAGRRFLAVLDPEGQVLSTSVFATEVALEPGWATWRCWPVGTSSDVQSLIDLTTGTTLATIARQPGSTRATDTSDTGETADDAVTGTTRIVSVSADGCALHLSGPEGQQILTPTARVPLPITVIRVVLAPDASAAVMVTNDGRARLVDLDSVDVSAGVLSDAIDLGIRRGILAFTNLPAPPGR